MLCNWPRSVTGRIYLSPFTIYIFLYHLHLLFTQAIKIYHLSVNYMHRMKTIYSGHLRCTKYCTYLCIYRYGCNMHLWNNCLVYWCRDCTQDSSIGTTGCCYQTTWPFYSCHHLAAIILIYLTSTTGSTTWKTSVLPQD